MNSEKQSKLFVIISMFIFGTIGIFVRYIPFPSSIIALVRGIVGTIFLLLVITIKKTPLNLKAIRSNLLLLCLSGAFIGVNWILLFESYRYTTVATATLCYYLAPVFVIIASPFILKEKLTLPKSLCVIAALIGMVFVSGVLTSGSSNAFNLKGILLGVGAAAFYACVILLNKHIKNISSYDMTIMQLGIAALVILPYTLLTEDFSALKFAPISVIMLLVVGIIHTGLAYTMYFSSIQGLKAQTVAIYSYIDPVVAIILSTLVLKENMGIHGIIGAVLILGSTLASELVEKRK